MNKIEAIYIHIPFCDHICTYCDFYKMIAKDTLKEKYIKYLIKELELKNKIYDFSDIKTIYIGGGTPSSIKTYLLKELFIKIKELINLDKISEYTFEANPCDISYDLAKLLKKYQINRISLGVQSLNNKKLSILGRNHTKKEVINAINILQNSKIYNINADIIYGIGNEKFNLIKRDLKILSRMNLTHFSTYSLILEQKTILSQKLAKNEFKLMNEEKEKKIYYQIIKYLQKKGYYQYEISNFSKPNFESTHNLTYWNNEHYLGIGANASYYIDDMRYTNINNLELYFKGIDNKDLIYLEKTKLDKVDKIKEELMLGLRKIKGISLLEFKDKYQEDLIDLYPVINDLIKDKILILNDNFLSISKKKLYMMNEILLKFF